MRQVILARIALHGTNGSRACFSGQYVGLAERESKAGPKNARGASSAARSDQRRRCGNAPSPAIAGSIARPT